MATDRYGYALSTSSPSAAAGWIDGADRFLAADGGALEAFERAIAEDDGFALAHAGRARVLQLRGLAAEARDAAARARHLAATATERERAHVDAIATGVDGDAAGALARIRAHVARFPRDAFALQPATNVSPPRRRPGRTRRGRAPRVGELVRIGGSHAQRDLFTHTLMAAYLRDGRIDDARALAERIPWRAERGGRALIDRASRGRSAAAGGALDVSHPE